MGELFFLWVAISHGFDELIDLDPWNEWAVREEARPSTTRCNWLLDASTPEHLIFRGRESNRYTMNNSALAAQQTSRKVKVGITQHFSQIRESPARKGE
jgi:hypothetical protein